MVSFPHNIRVDADPLPPSDGVTSYNFTLNGQPQTTSPTPSAVLVIPAPGTYTVGVSATNIWGQGGEGQKSTVAAVPGTPVNIQITVL